ncbi:MAG TPA: hypothetical protein VN181_07725, partial [Thermoanaerobaculia bacterium]|nr:hypothetical protein [Thermoanaerobaculia bacterium]
MIAAQGFAQWQPAGATSGSIYYNGGNVGVGVTAPGQRLTVGGNVAIGDVGSSPEMAANGVDWASSDGDHFGTGWSTGSMPAGGTVMSGQIFTGLGFAGRAQRVTYTSATAGSQGKLTTQPAGGFPTGKTFRISLSYRSSTVLIVCLNDSDLIVALPANSGNPVPISLMYTAIFDRNTLDFYAPGGGQTPTPGMWFEVDDVSVKQVTAGNLSAFGLLTGGGTAGIKVLGNGWTGIGTTSPAAPLQVNGAATQSQFYVTNGALNAGVMSALSQSTDNVTLGYDTDYVAGNWYARSATVARLRKFGGHFKIQGSGNNVVDGVISASGFNAYQDIDLATGVTEFTSPTVPNTSTRVSGGTIQLVGFPTKIAFGNNQYIADNASANMHIFAGQNLLVDTSVGDITMTPANGQFKVNGTVTATSTAIVGVVGGTAATTRLTVN